MQVQVSEFDSQPHVKAKCGDMPVIPAPEEVGRRIPGACWTASLA